jgi:hypothetical protein
MLLVAHHTGDSAELDKADMWEFGVKKPTWKCETYLINILPEILFSSEHKSNLK